MPYDPKTRPVFLGQDGNRTNPDRLKQGVMSVADQNQNQIPQEGPPSTAQNVLGIVKIVGLVLAGLAGSIVAASASGVQLPPALVSIATAIVAIAAPLGIASPGLGKSQPKVGPPAE